MKKEKEQFKVDDIISSLGIKNVNSLIKFISYANRTEDSFPIYLYLAVRQMKIKNNKSFITESKDGPEYINETNVLMLCEIIWELLYLFEKADSKLKQIEKIAGPLIQKLAMLNLETCHENAYF